jgi:hypothetical protein
VLFSTYDNPNKMKLTRLLSATFAGILLLSGCSPVKVVTDTKTGTDFSSLKTFKVVQFVNEEDRQSNNLKMNPMNRDRITAAIERNAMARGMEMDEAEPDVYILWTTEADIEKSYTSSTDYLGGTYWGYRGRYYYGGGPSYTTTTENKYLIAKLSIALVLPGNKEMIWFAQGTKDITGDAGKAEETINMVVDKTMENFPVGTPAE